MGEGMANSDLNHRRIGLLKDQVKLIKRKDKNRYEIAPIHDNLSFEKGFFAVVRACQLLTMNNEGLVLIGIAGPSGAGKTVFTEKITNFMPNVVVISMDNYNDASRIVDGNFDDPRLTDYDTLLKNIHDLKEGKSVDVPVYDFKSSSRTGYRRVEVPSSRVLILEGIYALNEKLLPLLDLRVSVTGGVHFDLVKRVLRDIQRAGQEPEEIIQQISETVYPMYKAFIEPDLRKAHFKIINKFNPFSGFQNPTYILKSSRKLSVEQIRSVMLEEHEVTTEQTYDIYLLPPGEDPETCQSYLRMRNRDGKYNLMFEEWVTDPPFVISPRISFEVSVRLLGGLMALGYTIAAILKRNSHVVCDERVCVKIDWLEQLNRHYIQVQGRERISVKNIADQLGLEGSYLPRTYIEQIQIEKLVNEVMAVPDDLKTKLSVDEDFVSSSPREAFARATAVRTASRMNNLTSGMSHSYSTNRDKSLSKLKRIIEDTTSDSSATLTSKGAANHLSEQISSLNDRMDHFTSMIEDLNSKLSASGKRNCSSAQNVEMKAETCNGSVPTSHFISGLSNGSVIPNPSSSSQLLRDPSLVEEISNIAWSQRQAIHQLESLNAFLRQKVDAKSIQIDDSKRDDRRNPYSTTSSMFLASLAVGGLGIFLCIKLRF